MKSIYCTYGSQAIPTQPLKMDWETGDIKTALRHTLDNSGIALSGTNIGLSLEQFIGGKTFINFDFTPNRNYGAQINDQKYGLINLYLEFDKPLPYNYQLIVYYIYNAGFVLNKNNEVLEISI